METTEVGRGWAGEPLTGVLFRRGEAPVGVSEGGHFENLFLARCEKGAEFKKGLIEQVLFRGRDAEGCGREGGREGRGAGGVFYAPPSQP